MLHSLFLVLWVTMHVSTWKALRRPIIKKLSIYFTQHFLVLTDHRTCFPSDNPLWSQAFGKCPSHSSPILLWSDTIWQPFTSLFRGLQSVGTLEKNEDFSSTHGGHSDSPDGTTLLCQIVPRDPESLEFLKDLEVSICCLTSDLLLASLTEWIPTVTKFEGLWWS